MTSAIDLIRECEALGIRLKANNDRLRVYAPMGVLTPELKKALGETKTQILEAIRDCTDPPKPMGDLTLKKTVQTVQRSANPTADAASALDGSKNATVQQQKKPSNVGRLYSEHEETRQADGSRGADQIRRGAGDRAADVQREITGSNGGGGQCASEVAQSAQPPQPGDCGASGAGGCSSDIRSQGGCEYLTAADITPKLDKEIIASIKAGNPLRVVSRTLGEVVYWVCDTRAVEKLRGQGIREVCYTLAELKQIAGQGPEFLRDIHRLKRTFNATLQKTAPKPALRAGLAFITVAGEGRP